MAELSPPPPNSGLRILLTKDRPPSSSSSTPAAAAAASVSSHADRDRIIGVFRAALSMTESPEAFALQAVQEAIKPQKQTVLVQEENQSLENALRTLLQELVSSAVQSGKKIMQYGNSLDNAESNCLITRLLDIVLYLCERGHVEGGMVFQLLEDLTEMSTIKDCKDVFGYIESKQDVLGKQELFGRGKLVMLRTCNQLLRRLSKANDVVFCGRIIMFLAHFFPLSERSALNIKGVFNTSNETKYEKDATDGISLDFNFYKTLWSLQEHFSNPALTATNPTKWQKFASNLTVVLSTFEAQPLSDDDGKVNNLDQEEDAAFNIKYLTSSKLMGLELKDASFRRHILVQCLIFFDYLKAPGKNDKEGPTGSMIEEIKSCEERVKKLLEMIPPKGKEFLQSIEHILEREKNWVWWKRDGCPAFEKQPLEKKSGQAGARKRKPRWRLGNKELAQLWKWAEQNPNALTDPERVRMPSVTEYWKPLAEDMDTSAGIEEDYHHKNNRVYCWKGLRFSARQDLEGFSRFCDYGIEGVVPPELLPPEVRSKFSTKPAEKAKRPKREEIKGTSAQAKEQQVAAATPETDGGGSGVDPEEGAVPMDSDNGVIEDGQKQSPEEVSGPETGQCEGEADAEVVQTKQDYLASFTLDSSSFFRAGEEWRALLLHSSSFTTCAPRRAKPRPRRSEATTALIDTSEHRGGSAAPSKRIPSGGGCCCWVQCSARPWRRRRSRRGRTGAATRPRAPLGSKRPLQTSSSACARSRWASRTTRRRPRRTTPSRSAPRTTTTSGRSCSRSSPISTTATSTSPTATPSRSSPSPTTSTPSHPTAPPMSTTAPPTSTAPYPTSHPPALTSPPMNPLSRPFRRTLTCSWRSWSRRGSTGTSWPTRPSAGRRSPRGRSSCRGAFSRCWSRRGWCCLARTRGWGSARRRPRRRRRPRPPSSGTCGAARRRWRGWW